MDRLEQLQRARARARGVRVVKLTCEDLYLARSRTYEPESYWRLLPPPRLEALTQQQE